MTTKGMVAGPPKDEVSLKSAPAGEGWRAKSRYCSQDVNAVPLWPSRSPQAHGGHGGGGRLRGGKGGIATAGTGICGEVGGAERATVAGGEVG